MHEGEEPIVVGAQYTDGTKDVVVTKIFPDKVWYRRADGRAITFGMNESWMYETNFRNSYRLKR